MIDRNTLLNAITHACSWLTDVAQVREEGEQENCERAARMWQKSWKGAIRGEYHSATGKWDMFCPVWHSGQAAKALCQAYSLTGEQKWLDSARLAGDFVLAQQETDEGPEFGLIRAVEDLDDCVNTSAILEALSGLLALYKATQEERYKTALLRAAEWVKNNAYVGNGHFLDNYSLREHAFTPPAWTDSIPDYRKGRPLADDSIFLEAYRLSGDPSFREIFYATADFLRTNETPAGTWNNYIPSFLDIGLSHPRQSFWWGMPMYDAYLDTGDTAYLDSLRRCGEWYLRAQRLDGGMFRNTDLQFNTPCFGLCTSGISCASLLWLRLYSIDSNKKWLEATERALRFNMDVQFRTAADPNMKGAVLEFTQLIPGSDASPYCLRDLATIFFLQAACQYIAL